MRERYASNTLCLRETDENFYLVAGRSFHSESLVYRRLRTLGHCAVYKLEKSGNQVFVYSRQDFQHSDTKPRDSTSDADNFTEDVLDVLQKDGGLVVLDPYMERVEDRVKPFNDGAIVI